MYALFHIKTSIYKNANNEVKLLPLLKRN
jgi:hypothetical protein